MKLDLLLILSILLLPGCANKSYPDLSHYTIDDFLEYPAYCTDVAQCRYIGYGEQNYGCPSNPVFQGLIIYSTKIGPKNIQYLKALAKESRFFKDQSSVGEKALTLKASFELEECLGIGNHKPKLMCVENKCIDNFWNEI